MNDVVLISIRYALATGAAALAVAIVQPSQPFLAVLAAYLFVARPFPGNALAGYLVAAWSGVAASLVLVALFPQQFWLLLPAFAVVVVLGLRQLSRWTGPSGVLLLAMGLCATLPAGIVDPREAVDAGWNHGANLTIGTLAAWLAFRLFAAMPRLIGRNATSTNYRISGCHLELVTRFQDGWAQRLRLPQARALRQPQLSAAGK
jgi:hypothetical protein